LRKYDRKPFLLYAPFYHSFTTGAVLWIITKQKIFVFLRSFVTALSCLSDSTAFLRSRLTGFPTRSTNHATKPSLW
jgi:hypothetical protein